MDWCKIKSGEFKFQLNEFGNFLNNRLRARCTALENTRQCRNTDAYSLVPIRRPKMSCQLRGEEYNEQRTAVCEIQPVRTLAKRNQGNDGVDRGQSTEKEFSGVRMTPVHGRKACFLSGSHSLSSVPHPLLRTCHPVGMTLNRHAGKQRSSCSVLARFAIATRFWDRTTFSVRTLNYYKVVVLLYESISRSMYT